MQTRVEAIGPLGAESGEGRAVEGSEHPGQQVGELSVCPGKHVWHHGHMARGGHSECWEVRDYLGYKWPEMDMALKIWDLV